MELGVISVRYARALLKGATNERLEDKVYDEMSALAQSYIRIPELRFTIDNPMLAKSQKESILLAASGGKGVSTLTAKFISLVVKAGREKAMQFIANSYVTLYQKQKNIIRSRLITATSVSSATQQKMRKMVEKRTQGTVEFQTEINPEIIGGFILEYGTYRLDASVQTQLRNIRTQLKR